MKIILLLLLYGIISQPLLAKKLYQYKDSQGQWHYSDKPPQTKQKVDVKQLRVEQKRYVYLHKIKEKSHYAYYVINDYHAPIELKVYFQKSKNTRTTPRLPHRFIIQPGESETLFTLSAANQYKAFRYSLRYTYTLGSPKAKHDNKAIYYPPFAPNSRFRVGQAFNGKFSHKGDQSRYAVDITMPLKTPIHASRAGIVMQVKNDFFKNGLSKKHMSRANVVRILHEDGTMASYVHLALETVQVYEGLKVAAGQLIGYSGNTGYSTGPHLHFSIQINRGMKLVSLPFKFKEKNGTAEPTAGKWLVRN